MSTACKSGTNSLARNLNFLVKLFSSIRYKVFFVPMLLLSILLVQVFISLNVQQKLNEDLESNSTIFEQLKLVARIERGVIDLQRIVLIYKETASSISVSRFESIFQRVQEAVTNLDSLTSDQSIIDKIERMSSHLLDYRENFAGVIEGRERRDEINNTELTLQYERVSQLLEDLWIKEKLISINQYNDARLAVERFRSLAFQYQLNSGNVGLNELKLKLRVIREQVSELSLPENHYKEISLAIHQLDKNIVRLAQVTRGYVYLVNVVMTGTANEFAFLAGEIRKETDKWLVSAREQSLQDSLEAKRNLIFISVFGFLLAIYLSVIFGRKIARPIQQVTILFNRLSKGQRVDDIDLVKGDDEIVQLTRAATVFKEKNEITKNLLRESEEHNERQNFLNNQLASEKKKAEDATNAKSSFLANMSHEIRTPMNGIMGLIELSLRTSDGPKMRQYLKQAYASTNILLNIINDILDFSKIEAGKLDIEEIPFNLGDTVENLLMLLSKGYADKSIGIYLFFDPKVPEEVMGDPVRVTQILMNICSNAIKFTDQGMVKIYIRHKKTSNGKVLIQLEVSDTGIGMTEEQLSNIFGAFTQADGTTSRKYGGTGLGLSIVKLLVNLMNGDISVKSKIGVGSQFNITFELSESRAELDRIAEIANLNNSPKRPTAVLIAENDKPCQISIDYLQSGNYPHDVGNYEDIVKNKKDEDRLLLFCMASEVSEGQGLRQISLLNKFTSKLGIILTSFQSELANRIEQELNLKVLVHPFTARQLFEYSDSLGKDWSSEDVERPLIESQPNSDFEKWNDKHVLLVEDNKVNQLVAKEMLKKLGLEVTIVDNGQKAVDLFSKPQNFDLVFMDVQMPVMDGLSATKALRDAGWNDLVIVGLSANAMKSDHKEADKAGMNDYLSKPVKLEQLQQTLKKYLN